MEEIVHAFGIDVRLIVVQMINFGILVGALWYFLYTPVLKMLEKRESLIKKGVEDAKQAEQDRNDAENAKQAVLREARGEAETIVSSATTHAEEKRLALLKEAEANAERVMHDAKARGEEIIHAARKASEAEVAEAAILAAERILNDKLAHNK